MTSHLGNTPKYFAGKARTQAAAFPQYAPALDAVESSQKFSSCPQNCNLM